jgi:hypothetical protein
MFFMEIALFCNTHPKKSHDPSGRKSIDHLEIIKKRRRDEKGSLLLLLCWLCFRVVSWLRLIFALAERYCGECDG